MAPRLQSCFSPRRRPRRNALAAAVAVALALNAAPARADCCDNFWSCFGAVMTAGLSCAIEAAVAEITDFINDMKHLRNDLAQQMNSMANAERQADTAERADWIAQVQPPAGQLAGLAQQAQAAQTIKINPQELGFGGGGGGSLKPGALSAGAAQAIANTPPPTATQMALKQPADLNATRTLLQRAAQQVQALAQVQHLQAVQQHAAAAKQASDGRLDGFSSDFKSHVLAALDSVIAACAVVDPIGLMAAIALANSELDAIRDKADALFKQFAQGDNAAEINARNAAYAAIQAAYNDAARAQQIVEAMNRLRDEPLQWEYQKLEELVGPNPPVIKAGIAMKVLAGNAGAGTQAALKQNLGPQFAALRTKLAQVRNRPAPMSTPVAQSRLEQQFAALYAGKTGAAALKQREDLKAQANVRFRDPTQRAAALRLIDDDAARRGLR